MVFLRTVVALEDVVDDRLGSPLEDAVLRVGLIENLQGGDTVSTERVHGRVSRWRRSADALAHIVESELLGGLTAVSLRSHSEKQSS